MRTEGSIERADKISPLKTKVQAKFADNLKTTSSKEAETMRHSAKAREEDGFEQFEILKFPMQPNSNLPVKKETPSSKSFHPLQTLSPKNKARPEKIKPLAKQSLKRTIQINLDGQQRDQSASNFKD